MQLETIAAVIGGIFAIAGIVAAGFAVVKSSYTRTQLELLRASVDDYEARTEQLESDRASYKLENETLKAKVTVLEGIVTSRNEIEHVQKLTELHEKTAGERHDIINGKLTRILTKMDKNGTQ